MSLRVVVLLSSRGSNFEAIADYFSNSPKVDITGVISNRPDAGGLDFAAARGIPTQVIDHKQYEQREAFDRDLLKATLEFTPDLVVLAGFMRILTDEYVRPLMGKLINIHPSLLPAYPGLNTHQRAIDAGDNYGGCSVHFVTPKLDAGPPIMHAKAAIQVGDTADKLAQKVLKQEHLLYPKVVELFADSRLELACKAEPFTAVLNGEPLPSQGLPITY